MTRDQTSLFDMPDDVDQDESELVKAARTTIHALETQNAIQEWHMLDCAIVIETARGVTKSRGIAKSQMIAALLQARGKLPEPIVAESDEAVQMEADRDLQWLQAHADSADVPDPQESESVH